MDLVDASPVGCLLCGSVEAPGLWLAQTSYLCRGHVVEVLGLVPAVPAFEHARIVDDLQARLAVSLGEAARAEAADRRVAVLEAEVGSLTAAAAHHGPERAALESALVEAQAARLEAEAVAAGSISVKELRKEIAAAVSDAWSASSNGRRKEKSASTSTAVKGDQ